MTVFVRHLKIRGLLVTIAGIALQVFLSTVEVHGETKPTTPKVSYKKAVKLGQLYEEISECSGMVASQQNKGVFWVHNDSGDSARIFAVKMDGRLIATVNVARVRAVDWEDIALGPGPDGKRSYLYVADTGNNDHSRKVNLAIYRIPEPSLEGVAAGTSLSEKNATRLPFVYDSGTHDCEAFAIHPGTADGFLFTKSPLGTAVFRIENIAKAEEQTVLTAKKIATLPVRVVTAADMTPDGGRLVLRNYYSLAEYAFDVKSPFEPEPELLFRLRHLEAQGEAACYTVQGSILTTSEGIHAPMFLFESDLTTKNTKEL